MQNVMIMQVYSRNKKVKMFLCFRLKFLNPNPLLTSTSPRLVVSLILQGFLWTTTCVSNNSECTHLTQFDTLHIKSRALDIKSRALDPKSVACHLLPNQERSPLELVGDLSRPMVRMQVVIELEIKTIQSEYKSCQKSN